VASKTIWTGHFVWRQLLDCFPYLFLSKRELEISKIMGKDPKLIKVDSALPIYVFLSKSS
jgi:hypothetical protein